MAAVFPPGPGAEPLTEETLEKKIELANELGADTSQICDVLFKLCSILAQEKRDPHDDTVKALVNALHHVNMSEVDEDFDTIKHSWMVRLGVSREEEDVIDMEGLSYTEYKLAKEMHEKGLITKEALEEERR